MDFSYLKTASAIPGAAAMIETFRAIGSCRYCGQLDIGIGQKRMDQPDLERR